MSIAIDKDIKFDRFGDIAFLGNDIDTLVFYQDILYQNILDRLITNFNDYDLLPNYGADISGAIGSKADSELEFVIEDKIIRALTSDGFLFRSEISIDILKENEKIFMRITILGVGNGLSLTDSFKIDAIFNTSSGTLNATN